MWWLLWWLLAYRAYSKCQWLLKWRPKKIYEDQLLLFTKDHIKSTPLKKNTQKKNTHKKNT